MVLQSIELVVMDSMMPVCDGETAIRRIRALKHITQPYIAALSANTEKTHEARLFEAGANEVLFKPLTLAKMGVCCGVSVRRAAKCKASST